MTSALLMGHGSLTDSPITRSWAILLGILSAAALVVMAVVHTGRRYAGQTYEQGFLAGVRVGEARGEQRGQINGRAAALLEAAEMDISGG